MIGFATQPLHENTSDTRFSTLSVRHMTEKNIFYELLKPVSFKDCSKAVVGIKNPFDLILTYVICSLSLDDGSYALKWNAQ